MKIAWKLIIDGDKIINKYKINVINREEIRINAMKTK